MAMKRLEKVPYFSPFLLSFPSLLLSSHLFFLSLLFITLLYFSSFSFLRTSSILFLFFNLFLLNLFFLHFTNTLFQFIFPTVLMYHGILVLDPFFRSTSTSVRIRCGTKKNSVGSTVCNRRSPANGRHTSIHRWKWIGFW